MLGISAPWEHASTSTASLREGAVSGQFRKAGLSSPYTAPQSSEKALDLPDKYTTSYRWDRKEKESRDVFPSDNDRPPKGRSSLVLALQAPE